MPKKKFRSNCDPGHKCEYDWKTEWKHTWTYIGMRPGIYSDISIDISIDWCPKCGTIRETLHGKMTYKYRRNHGQ